MKTIPAEVICKALSVIQRDLDEFEQLMDSHELTSFYLPHMCGYYQLFSEKLKLIEAKFEIFDTKALEMGFEWEHRDSVRNRFFEYKKDLLNFRLKNRPCDLCK